MDKLTKEIRLVKYEWKLEEYLSQVAIGIILFIISGMVFMFLDLLWNISNDNSFVIYIIFAIFGAIYGTVLSIRAAWLYQKYKIKLEVLKRIKVKKKKKE